MGWFHAGNSKVSQFTSEVIDTQNLCKGFTLFMNRNKQQLWPCVQKQSFGHHKSHGYGKTNESLCETYDKLMHLSALQQCSTITKATFSYIIFCDVNY